MVRISFYANCNLHSVSAVFTAYKQELGFSQDLSPSEMAVMNCV